MMQTWVVGRTLRTVTGACWGDRLLWDVGSSPKVNPKETVETTGKPWICGVKSEKPEDPWGAWYLPWLFEAFEWVMFKVRSWGQQGQPWGHRLYDPTELCSCSSTAEIGCNTQGPQCQIRAGMRSRLCVKATLLWLDKDLQAGQMYSGVHVFILPIPSNKRLGTGVLPPLSATTSWVLQGEMMMISVAWGTGK